MVAPVWTRSASMNVSVLLEKLVSYATWMTSATTILAKFQVPDVTLTRSQDRGHVLVLQASRVRIVTRILTNVPAYLRMFVNMMVSVSTLMDPTNAAVQR